MTPQKEDPRIPIFRDLQNVLVWAVNQTSHGFENRAVSATIRWLDEAIRPGTPLPVPKEEFFLEDDEFCVHIYYVHSGPRDIDNCHVRMKIWPKNGSRCKDMSIGGVFHELDRQERIYRRQMEKDRLHCNVKVINGCTDSNVGGAADSLFGFPIFGCMDSL